MDSEAAFHETLVDALARWGLRLGDEQIAQMAGHFVAMVEKNRLVNLTRIVDPVAAAVKHYADSLALLLWERREAPTIRTVLDIGTGAGFPAVPLAIARPEWLVTALDGTRKKIDFLDEVSRALRIENIRPVWAHSEHWDKPDRHDLVMFRALGNLGESLERAATRVAPGGWVVAYRTPRDGVADAQEADPLASKVGLRRRESLPYDLRIGNETVTRVLLIFHPSA